MRRFAVVSLIGGLSLSAPAVAGEHGWYAGIEGGVDWVEVTGPVVGVPLGGLLGLGGGPLPPDGNTSAGLAVFGVIGTSLTDRVRLEGELGYRKDDFDGGLSDISNATLMLNGLFDIPLSTDLTLSIGAGIGFDWIDVTQAPGVVVFGGGDDDITLAYQGLFGFAYDMGGVDLTLNYRYMMADIGSNAVTTGGYTIISNDMDSNAVTIGLRFDL